jgi:hypothetical protein
VDEPNVEGITPEQFIKLGKYLMQGMNESEAAVLAGIDRLALMVAKRSSHAYNNFVERKKLEFKSKHLEVLSGKPDAKVSQWLLERLSPEEFSNKQGKSDVPGNVVGAIIKEIQDGGSDASALKFAYKEIYDKGSIESQGASGAEAEKRIRSILS